MYWQLSKASIHSEEYMSLIYSMTSITFPMREKKPQQIGNYLLATKTPRQLKAEMDENNHALSDLIIDDPTCA